MQEDIFSLLILITPLVGFINQVIKLINVVFPAPEGPTNPKF